MNWYKCVKLAQYDLNKEGFWLDPEGNLLDVHYTHETAMTRSGWLDPDWESKYDTVYAAASAQNFIRIALDKNNIMFAGWQDIIPTPEQKEVMHNMFLSLKRDDNQTVAHIEHLFGKNHIIVQTVQEFDELIGYTYASSNKQIKLAKMDEVQIPIAGKIKTVKYLINPTRQEIIGFINRIAFQNRDNEYRSGKSEIRGVFLNDALYVWDSWDSNHCFFCKAVGGGEQCNDKNYKCYDEDYDHRQNKLFAEDGLTFKVFDEDKLMTNIPSKHKNVSYFHNRGELQPYMGDEESKWGSPWTHTWQSDLE